MNNMFPRVVVDDVVVELRMTFLVSSRIVRE